MSLRGGEADEAISFDRKHKRPGLLRCARNDSWAFITAWNPCSHRMPDGWNHRMQQRLRERLRRHQTAPAESVLRNWREDMLFVRADPRQVLRLARLFRQRAIVALRGRRARLRFTPPSPP